MRPEFFEVRFGDVFRYSRDPSKLLVVNGLYEVYVNVCGVQTLEDGREIIVFGGGSATYDEIGEIVDHWDLERVKKGISLGYQLGSENMAYNLKF